MGLADVRCKTESGSSAATSGVIRRGLLGRLQESREAAAIDVATPPKVRVKATPPQAKASAPGLKRARSSPNLIVVKRQKAEPETMTPLKSTQFETPEMKREVKAETTGSSMSADIGDLGAVGEDEFKLCSGCYRTYGVDKHFWLPKEEVPLLYADGRGEWCKDCNCLFRVMYKASMTLSLFGRWLKNDSNRADFCGNLLAYLTMKYDGINHIGKPQLEQRVKTLQCAFRLAGAPWPLAALQEIHSVSSLDNAFVVPVLSVAEPSGAASSASARAMALVPRPVPRAPPPTASARFVTAWEASQGWPLFAQWSADEQVVSWWNGLGSDVAPEVAADANDDSLATGPARSGPPKQPAVEAHEATFVCIMITARLLVKEMDTPGHPKTKERDFTPVLAKLLKFKQELVESSVACYLGPLMKRVDSLVESMSAAKKVVRPLRDYVKRPKVSYLMQAGPSLNLVVDFLKSEHIRLGPEIGSAHTKAEFLVASEKGSSAALDVLRRPGAFSWNSEASPDAAPTCVIWDCLTNFLYQQMKVVVEEGASKWADTKTRFAEVVNDFLVYTASIVPTYPEAEPLQSLLQCVKTVCGAAQQDHAVSPQALQQALNDIESSEQGGRIQEGFRTGVGAALLVDAKVLLAVGELDDQCNADFMQAVQNILGTGVDVNEESGWVVPAECCSCSGPASDMVSIITEGMEKLSEVIVQWSATMLTREMESLTELFYHIAKHIALYDAGKVTKCIECLGSARATWEAAMVSLTSSTWPPSSLSPADISTALPDKMDEDTGMTKLCDVLKRCCKSAATRACAFSTELSEANKILEIEAERYIRHRSLRRAIWCETFALKDLMQLQWQDDGCGVQSLFEAWSFTKEGFLSELMKIAAVRPHFDYSEKSILPASTPVVVANREFGYLPFSDPTRVKDFMQSYLQGNGIENVANKFLFTNLEAFVGLALDEFAKALDFAKLAEEAVKVEPGTMSESGCYRLQQLLPAHVVASMGKLGGDIDFNCNEPSGLASQLTLKAACMLQPLRDLVAISSSRDVKSKVALDESSLSAQVVLAVLEMYGHVADMLTVAAFVAEGLLADSGSLVQATRKAKQPKTSSVVPIFASSLSWLCHAGGLAWLQLTSSTDLAALPAKLRYPKEDLDKIVGYMTSTWVESAKARAATLLAEVIDDRSTALKLKTPPWAHIASHSRYNATLARKQLIDYPQLASVADLIDEVSSLKSHMGTLLGETELATCTSVMEADAVADAAKTAMAVVAAVKIIEIPSTPGRSEMASALLAEKTCGLPEALKVKLRSLAAS